MCKKEKSKTQTLGKPTPIRTNIIGLSFESLMVMKTNSRNREIMKQKLELENYKYERCSIIGESPAKRNSKCSCS